MAASEYSMLFKLSAQLGREFGSTFGTAKRTINDTQREINSLNQTQSDIAAYEKQQRAVESTERKLADLQKQYDNIQREIQETEGFSSALENKLIEKQRAIDKTSESLNNQTDKLHQMGSALQDAGVDTDHLTDESDKLKKKMDELAKQQAEATEKARQFGVEGVNSFEMVGSAMVAAGIAAGLKAIYNEYQECISIAADFEETMSTVEALSDASVSELQELSSYAKELGATTKFTAKESAEAMTYMAMAGWDAEQMLDGMSGLLNLAAASGEDLAATADIVTDNLTAFGLKASDTARFSDVLAAAATNSNTSVAIMGETFKNSAALAGALGYSIEDVAVAIGLMANAGIKGSNAGTALKNIFNGLLSGVTLTSEAFGEVEYSAINADGTMKSFGETLQDLRGYFEQMTGAEKLQNAETLAGQRAMAGFVSIMNSTDADFEKLTNSIENCSGAAQKMADVKMDNLNGQLTLLNSATDALKTTIGEAYNEELRALAKVGTDILTGINDFLSKHPVFLKSLIAITAEVGLIVAAYYGYIAAKKIMNTVRALSTVLRAKETVATAAETTATVAQTGATTAATVAQTGLNAAMMANPIGLVIAAVAALTVGIIALVQASKEEIDETKKLTEASEAHRRELESLNTEYEAVCSEFGETSYQAQELSWKIAELTDEYERSKQTIAEYKEMQEEARQSFEESQNAHANELKELEKESAGVFALIARLEALTSQSHITTQSQQEILAIIKALNEEVPGLSLSYDELTNSISSSHDAIMRIAEARFASQKMDEMSDQIVENLKLIEQQEAAMKAAEENRLEAQKNLDRLQESYDKWHEKHKYSLNTTKNASQLGKYYREIGEAQQAVQGYTDDVTNAQNAIEKLKEDNENLANSMSDLADSMNEAAKAEGDLTDGSLSNLDKAMLDVQKGYLDVADAARYYGVSSETLQKALDDEEVYEKSLFAAIDLVKNGYYSAQEAAEIYGVTVDAIDQAGNIQEAIDKISELGAKYHEVKDAAEKSIQGQFDLWDTAAIVIPTDIESINTALETQLSYWSDYNTDLASLSARAGDIEGLADVIASFADGSTESVNAIAGMADASDEDLRKMVSQWQEVQKQQEEASTSIAELATGFSSELDGMKSELETAVNALNLDDEAAAAAKATVDGYVQAIRSGTGDAVTAAASLRSQVAAALKSGGSGGVPGYASGTESAKSGLALVGEKGPELVMFNGGEQVLTTDETRAYLRQMNGGHDEINAYAEGAGEYTDLIMILPMLERMLDAIPRTDAVPAESGQQAVITIAPTFNVQGGGDIEETLRSFVGELKDEIMDALEDSGVDAKRVRYA